MKNIKATIFIPTYNGEMYIKDILKAIFSQQFDDEFEVLIIDSGSKDNTLSIIDSFAKKYKNLVLKEIPNNEFGHGRTRNLAASLAKGEFIVYITHDAIPSHKRWLYEMLKPFEINQNINAVMGKQIPRAGCFPLLKYEINHVFSAFGPDFGTTIFYNDYFIKDDGLMDAVSFYSDVNSATRTRFLLETIPYRDVKYAEDQMFGRDIVEKGYYKVYAPRASVIHSNDMYLREYKKRMFDETIALRKNGVIKKKYSNKTMVKSLIKGMLGDTKRIIKDKSYSFKRKLYWLVVNPLFHIEKWRGIRLAMTIGINDSSEHDKHSLESSRKV